MLDTRRAVAALSLLFASACGFTEQFAFCVKSEHGIEHAHATSTVDFGCPPGTRHVRVAFSATGRSGSLRVSLTDPTGAVRWSDAAGKGQRDVALCLAALAGRWRCELRFDDFSGGYGLELTSRTEPSRIALEITDVRIAKPAEETAGTGR